MKLVYCFILLLCPYCNRAQTAIHIGETVPDIEIPHVYNYSDSVIQLSKFKSKLTIIDFWTTGCGSCIESFPTMRALKKKFGSNLEILFVDNYSGDTKFKADKLFKRLQLQSGESFTFPYALQDTLLTGLFPHLTVPHCVWLDSSLKVIAITYHDEVNRDNIQQYFSGTSLALPVKIDGNVFDPSTPFLVNDNGGSPGDFIYRSIISGYRDNLQMTIGKQQDDTGAISKMYIINYPLYDLFQMAYHDILKHLAFRTFIEAKDSLLFKRDKHLDKDKQHLFCYELITPSVSMEKATRYLQADLERTFHAVARSEMRLMDCYVLTTNSNISQSITRGGIIAINTDKESEHKYLKNTRLSWIVSFLEGLVKETIVDETKLTQNIDMELPSDFYQFSRQQLIAWLYQCGFTLTPEKRLMEVAVITDSK